MNQAEFRGLVRMLANDGPCSNPIQRERLVDRPGNVFDGINTVFQLNNRRITGCTLYDENNIEVSASAYTLASGTGRIICTTPPTSPATYTDYYFNYLDDTEMDLAISGAAASGGFDPTNVNASALDFSSMYALAFVYTAAASKAATYYSLSAAGKQVSKSEIFNHFSQLAGTTLSKATEMRRDQFTDRGLRDQVGEAHGRSSYALPYIQDSNE